MGIIAMWVAACDAGGGADDFAPDAGPRSTHPSDAGPRPDGYVPTPDAYVPPPPAFPGFTSLAFTTGTYWEYSWRETGKHNGQTTTPKTGVVRIQLGNYTDYTFTSLGTLRFYAAQYTTRGATPMWLHNRFQYLAVKDGTIYVGKNGSSGFQAWTLFSAQDGSIYQTGFTGYLSASRPETVTAGTISNAFVSGPAVVVNEPFNDPMCETIAGVTVCDETSHNYAVREYFTPSLGFTGFYRSGSSVYTGGGFYDNFQSTLEVGVTCSSLAPQLDPCE